MSVRANALARVFPLLLLATAAAAGAACTGDGAPAAVRYLRVRLSGAVNEGFETRPGSGGATLSGGCTGSTPIALVLVAPATGGRLRQLGLYTRDVVEPGGTGDFPLERLELELPAAGQAGRVLSGTGQLRLLEHVATAGTGRRMRGAVRGTVSARGGEAETASLRMEFEIATSCGVARRRPGARAARPDQRPRARLRARSPADAEPGQWPATWP